jgi:hypothetical protein
MGILLAFAPFIIFAIVDRRREIYRLVSAAYTEPDLIQ